MPSPEAQIWLSSFLTNRDPPPLLDLRPLPHAHIQNATDMPLTSIDPLLARTHELPPPTKSSSSPLTIGIICDTHLHTQVTAHITRRGYASIHISPLDIPATHTHMQPDSRALWLPAPLLLRALGEGYVKRPCGDGRTVLDVGSGAGRNAAFLAMAGFDVIAVDRDARLLDKTQALLENYSTHPCMPWHVERGEVRCVQRTLGAHLQRDREWLQDNAADVVLVVRFLRRGVLQLLPGAVREGGVLLYEHFLMGCEKFGGPNKRAQMLERGELAAIFAPPLFRILLDEESTLSDGRPITRFICQRLPNT